MKKILLTLGLLGILTTNTYALSEGECSGNYCYKVDIEKIYVTKNGRIYIGTKGNEKDLYSGGVSGIFTIINEENPGRDILYSLALTAYTTHQKVTIAVTGKNIEYIYIVDE